MRERIESTVITISIVAMGVIALSTAIAIHSMADRLERIEKFIVLRSTRN